MPQSSVCCLLLVWFLLDLFFDPEDGVNTFLQNVSGLLRDHMSLLPAYFFLVSCSDCPLTLKMEAVCLKYQCALLPDYKTSCTRREHSSLALVCHLPLAGFFLGLFFDPEREGSTFLWNVSGHYQTTQRYTWDNSTLHRSCSPPNLAGCLLALLLNPKDGGSTLTWNICGLPPDYMALHHRIKYPYSFCMFPAGESRVIPRRPP
jgi:hypothetical protein